MIRSEPHIWRLLREKNDKYIDFLELFLQNGCAKNISDTFGAFDNALTLASKYGNLRMVRLLILYGFDFQNCIGKINRFGENSAHLLSKLSKNRNSYKILTELIKSPQCKINETNNDDMTPLHISCKYNNVKVMLLLLSNISKYTNTNKSDIMFNKTGLYKHSPIYEIVKNNSYECLSVVCDIMDKSYLFHKINIIESNKRETLLMYSVQRGNIKIIQKLISKMLHEKDVKDWNKFETINNRYIKLSQLCEIAKEIHENNVCFRMLHNVIVHGINKKDFNYIATILNYDYGLDERLPGLIQSKPNNSNAYNIITNINIVSKWIVGDILGKGSFGIVKLGIDPYTNEKVALKFINKSKNLNPKSIFITQLSEEIQNLRNMDPPNIIKLLSYDMSV